MAGVTANRSPLQAVLPAVSGLLQALPLPETLLGSDTSLPSFSPKLLVFAMVSSPAATAVRGAAVPCRFADKG